MLFYKKYDRWFGIKREKRSQEIFKFLINNYPKTLYEIEKETKIPFSSIHLAIKNLLKKNLIKLDHSASQDRGRGATIYMPTFKGLLTFLSKHRPDSSISLILEKNGEHLHYPLFQYCHYLKGLTPRLYEVFIQISREVLGSPFRLSDDAQLLIAQKEEVERKLKGSRYVSEQNFRMVINGKEMPYNPFESYREQLRYVNFVLNTVFLKEEEILKEAFFARFLSHFLTTNTKWPNKELYNYAKALLERKKEEFNSIKEIFEKGMSFFS